MTTFLSILVLGFFLGMRHATDPDHVIAVTTIVSRQRDIRNAALTGIFWGIGHSITLLVVGGAIILLGLVIPQRLGLSLEFCGALMLILLGALISASHTVRCEAQARKIGTENSTITRIDTATMSIRIHTDTLREHTAIRMMLSCQRAWIDNSVDGESIALCDLLSLASCTVSPAQRRLRCLFCRSFAIHSGQ